MIQRIMNGALRKYIKDVAYQEAPFTTSLEFLSYISEVVPDSLNYIIEGWFEKSSTCKSTS